MSSNKKSDKKTSRMFDGMRAAFLGRDGSLRALWRVAIAVVAYYVWTTGVTVVLTHAFGALFDAWGVTTRNLHLAPGYVRWLAGNYGHILSVISSLGVAVFAYLAAPERARLQLRAAKLGLGMALGAACVLVGGALMLLIDSMRMTSSSPALSWTILTYLPVLLMAAVSEEFFARGYVLRMVARRANRLWAYAASAVVFFLITKAYAFGFVGMINMLLMSIVLCAVSERYSSWATIGLRFGWSYAVTCLMGFPGADSPVLLLYSVSEEWFTGGGSGLIGGLYMTALLIAAIWLLFRKQIAKRWLRVKNITSVHFL